MTFTPPTLASETIATIAGFPIRNSMLMAWLAMLLIIIVAIIFKRKGGKLVPKGLQNFVEIIIEGLFDFFNSVTQDKKQTRRFFPIVATLFIFVILSNWMGILPGVGAIGIYEKEHGHVVESVTGTEMEGAPITHEAVVPHTTEESDTKAPESTEVEPAAEAKMVFVPLFRSAYADVNMTLALAIISIVMTQVYGIWSLGLFHYAGKFFVNPLRDPIGSFVGILELFAEFAKVISFTFRLFGNIFAGEMLLTVISFLAPYLAPLPFYGLEIFVGFIQALVFSLLTLVFMKMAATAHGGDAHDEQGKSHAVPA